MFFVVVLGLGFFSFPLCTNVFSQNKMLMLTFMQSATLLQKGFKILCYQTEIIMKWNVLRKMNTMQITQKTI